MARYISILTALLFLLALPSTVEAKKDKKKQKTNFRVEPPSPDLRIPALKPDKPLAPIHEPGAPKAVNNHREYFGNHKVMSHGGIDVSHYQGQIDWRAVAHSGRVKYVFCKATENTTLVDNTFNFNVREARKNGIPVGSYHFFSPNVSGAAQLQHFLENVDMSTQDVIPMLDVEVRGKQSLEKFHAEIRAWLEGFEKQFHYKPIIYASVNFYNKYLAGAFDDYKYMMAKYSEEPPNPQGPIPMVMWQYSSHGHVDGIRGAVDMSWFCDNHDVKDILIKHAK